MVKQGSTVRAYIMSSSQDEICRVLPVNLSIYPNVKC